MKLDIKKNLAAKTLGVGTSRVQFDTERLDEIKEAITRQDIKDLVTSGAIKIKEVKGRRVNIKRKHRKRGGKIKLKVNKRKEKYVILTRKLRKHLVEMKKHGKISDETIKEVRKGIRNSVYKSKRHLKEHIDKTLIPKSKSRKAKGRAKK